MTAANRDNTTLIDVLDEQIREAEAMLQALALENQALLDNDTDRLNLAGADKARRVESLENLEQERRDLTAALQIELSSVDATDAGIKWRELLNLIDECRQRNQRNGSLVRARREQVLGTLKALRGTETEIYDARGLERPARSARRLGSA